MGIPTIITFINMIFLDLSRSIFIFFLGAYGIGVLQSEIHLPHLEPKPIRLKR